MKLHKITSQDSFRPATQHVFIDKDNVVATNAQVLVIVPKVLIFGEEDIPEMFVIGRDWAKIYPRKNHYLKYEENHLVLYGKTRSYTGEVARVRPILKENAEFNYPAYMKIIPDGKLEMAGEVGINSYYMSLYNEATGINEVKLSFYGRSKAIAITPLNHEYRDVRAIVMPVMFHEWL